MFKGIFDFFKPKKKIKRNDILQIALILALLVVSTIIVHYINLACGGEESKFAQHVIAVVLDKVPLFQELAALMLSFFWGNPANAVLAFTPWTLLKALPETMLVSVCCHFYTQILHRNPKKATKSTTLMPAILGITTATIFIMILNIFISDKITMLLESCLLCIIIIFGIILAIKSLFIGEKKGRKKTRKRKKETKEIKAKNFYSLGRLFLFIIDGLYAVIISCYSTSIMVVVAGLTTGFWNIFWRIALLSLIVLVASSIVGYINKKVKEEYEE